MGTPLVLRLDGVSAKIESTYGTDAAPVATANALRLNGRLWPGTVLDFAMPNSRKDVANSSIVAATPAAARGRKIRFRIPWEIKGAGSAYAANNLPEADPLFQACGFGQTLVTTGGSESVTYAFAATAAHPSATIYGYAAGMLIKAVGCRGTCRITIDAGKIATALFDMQGMVVSDPTDTALPTNFNYDAQLPPPAVGLAMTVGSWSPDSPQVVFDSGNPVEVLESVNGADGIQAIDFGEAMPMLTVVAKTAPIATYTPSVDQKTPTGRALSLVQGGTQYNKMSITDSGLAIVGFPFEDQKKFAGYRVQYQMTAPQIIFN